MYYFADIYSFLQVKLNMDLLKVMSKCYSPLQLTFFIELAIVIFIIKRGI